jgi:multidrug efflux pump subunit AcrA (membrane-fusion protein)
MRNDFALSISTENTCRGRDCPCLSCHVSIRAGTIPAPTVLKQVLALLALVVFSACQSQTNSDSVEARGLIIVNAPATGEIRRVLVREGMQVNEGAPVVEIAIRVEGQSAPPAQAEDPQARAATTIRTSQAEVEAARADVVRKEVEMQRLSSLVATGDAPQAQLDGARAEFEQAQRRLQQAQSKAENAQTGLSTARQQSQNPSTPVRTFSEQIVTAQASSAGTVSVINAKVGDKVTMGQPLATLRAGQ